MSGSLDGSQSDESSRFERLYIEPIYDAFVCPLTRRAMRDPVSLANGRTFEREAIEKWFEECRDSGRTPVCPITHEELQSTDLQPSIALRNTIAEWKARNEAAQLDMARKALNTGNVESEILPALQFIKQICQNNRSTENLRWDSQPIPMIVEMLQHTSVRVRCKALQTLQVVVEQDQDSKERLAEGDTVRRIVKLLNQDRSVEREHALSLLLELSRSEVLCEKIGSINGAILILMGMASSKSENIANIEKANETLRNLEVCESNVRVMASNGKLRPLLTKLLEGSPESRLSMASFLGELPLNNEVKVLVASDAGSSLIEIMRDGNMQSREAALKALNQISSYDGSARLLIDAGILQPLIRDLFTVGPNQLPPRLKEISATILANVVNTGYDLEKVSVGPDNVTLVSDSIVHNLLQLISNTGPAIECQLLQVMVGLTSSATTVARVVSAIRSSGATISLVQFIEAPQNDLRLACIKLLCNLAPHMSQELAGALRGTAGQLGGLTDILAENTGITEEQASAAGLIAELPERDLGLSRQLLDEGSFQSIISKLIRIRKGDIIGNRFVNTFQEGLVRILARVTFILSEEPRAIALCREHDLAHLFVDLLQQNVLDGIQVAAAMALENLALETKNLSRRPEMPRRSFCASFFTCVSEPPVQTGVCRLHGGLCTLKNTFCLLEGQAVARLVALLDHRNENVVEAALAALSTVLEDGVDIMEGINILDEAQGINPILEVLIENQTARLRGRGVWMVERILRSEDIAREIAEDTNVSSALVDAFQSADYITRQIAERALRHIDRLPNFSGIFPNPA